MAYHSPEYPKYSVELFIVERNGLITTISEPYIKLKDFSGKGNAQKYCRTMHTLSIRYQEGKEKGRQEEREKQEAINKTIQETGQALIKNAFERGKKEAMKTIFSSEDIYRDGIEKGRQEQRIECQEKGCGQNHYEDGIKEGRQEEHEIKGLNSGGLRQPCQAKSRRFGSPSGVMR